MAITDFRSTLVEKLIKKETIPENISNKHVLKKTNRSRCIKCYVRMAKVKGRKYAQKNSTKVQTK